jgi:hypothetical protein
MKILQCVFALSLFTVQAAAQAPAQPQPTSGNQVVVQLVGGDSLRGELVSETPDSIIINHSVLGQMTIARSNMTSMVTQTANPAATPNAPANVAAISTDITNANQASSEAVLIDSAKGAATGAPAAGSAAEAPKPVLPVSNWKFVLAANANYTDASDKQLDFRVAGAAVYEIKDVEKWKTDAEYFFKTVNDATTDNNLLVTSVYDRDITATDWLWFLKAQGQASSLEAWEERLSGWGGIGYRFFKAPPIAIVGKVGLGATHEFGAVNETYPEGYLELDGKWDITERQSLQGNVYIAPDLSDISQYMTIARAEWALKVDPELGLSLVGGLRFQYQSNVPAGENATDLRVYAGLKMDF